jgi:excisionase family DNA binding protein
MTDKQFEEIIIRLDAIIRKDTECALQVYTVGEVAIMLKVSHRTISRAIKTHQLRPSKIGDWRITDVQLKEWLENRRPAKKSKI